jgi:hypothetical protein
MGFPEQPSTGQKVKDRLHRFHACGPDMRPRPAVALHTPLQRHRALTILRALRHLGALKGTRTQSLSFLFAPAV